MWWTDSKQQIVSRNAKKAGFLVYCKYVTFIVQLTMDYAHMYASM